MSESTTHLDIDGLDVVFPFPSAYPEQTDYMKQLKLSLDAAGPCVLEMPSGTGKTISLLSLILAYMAQNPDIGPLIYCTRTIPELDQGIAELRRLHKCRLEATNSTFDQQFLGIALSRRSNYCILPEAADAASKDDVDTMCRVRTLPWSETKCEFFEHALLRPQPGVYSLTDLRDFSSANGICPFFLSRRLITEAQVIFGSFAYLLDPKASEFIFKAMQKTAIVVFDEAHNIDDVCCEFMSVYTNGPMLDRAADALNIGVEIANQIKDSEQQKLQKAYEKLRTTIQSENEQIVAPETLEILNSPIVPTNIAQKAIPKSIQNFDDFIIKARKLIQFYSAFLEGVERPDISAQIKDVIGDDVEVLDKAGERFTPDQIVARIESTCQINRETMQMMSTRFTRFLLRNRVKEFDQFVPLLSVLDFAAVMSTYNEGFYVFVEPTHRGKLIQLACVDSTLAFSVVKNHFDRIVITSGTLSPLSIYPTLLGFEPVCMVDFTMSLSRNCLLPLIVTHGIAQAPLSSSFKLRDDERVPRAYGELLLTFCQTIPDGIVVFFPSYVYMQIVFDSWTQTGLIPQIMENKLIFCEAVVGSETLVALANYRRAIENGRGAVFLAVARGRVSEGIDFADQYGRCVLLFGLPVRNTMSMIVQARAQYIEAKYGLERSEFIMFDAMRAASQCIGRLLRSKNDYGVVVLADKRYTRSQLKGALPHWIRQFLDDQKINISIDAALDATRDFMLQMAQPFKHDPTQLVQNAERHTF